MGVDAEEQCVELVCSPGRCRLGKAGQGWQTSGRWHRYDGCRCNYHTMHSRNLRAVKKQRDDIMHHLWKTSSGNPNPGPTRRLSGVQAVGGDAGRGRTLGCSVNAGAGGAGTVRVPRGTFLVFHLLQHTGYEEIKNELSLRARLHWCTCLSVYLCRRDSRRVDLRRGWCI